MVLVVYANLRLSLAPHVARLTSSVVLLTLFRGCRQARCRGATARTPNPKPQDHTPLVGSVSRAGAGNRLLLYRLTGALLLGKHVQRGREQGILGRPGTRREAWHPAIVDVMQMRVKSLSHPLKVLPRYLSHPLPSAVFCSIVGSMCHPVLGGRDFDRQVGASAVSFVDLSSCRESRMILAQALDFMHDIAKRSEMWKASLSWMVPKYRILDPEARTVKALVPGWACPSIFGSIQGSQYCTWRGLVSQGFVDNFCTMSSYE